MKNVLAFAPIIFVLLAGACDDREHQADGGTRDVGAGGQDASTAWERPLAEHKALWERSQPPHYRYRFETSCFCQAKGKEPVWIEVRGGQTVAITDGATGEPVTAARQESLDDMSTIEKLFTWIEQVGRPASGRGRAPDQLEVSYDATLGYPTRIAIDAIADAVDDEFSYQITALETLD